MMGLRPALFLDRDGTIIVERHYLADPAGVDLVPGVAPAIREFADAGYAVVVVTNQSGIARGLYSFADFTAVQARLEAMLAEQGVRFDAVYHCPHLPEISGPCECRKPFTGMYRAAARELNLDLPNSIYVGDRIKDVVPALELKGRGFLVRTGYGAEEEPRVPAGIDVVDDLPELAQQVLGGENPH